MSDFQQVTNNPVYHAFFIGDKVMDCYVSQFKMKDLEYWLGAVVDITEQLQTDISSLIATHLNQLQAMVYLCVDFVDTAKLADLELNATEFIRLVQCVVDVNSAYFKHIQQQNKTKRNQKDDDNSWFTSFQLLISHGHSLDSVQNMGFGQFLGFVKAVQDEQKRHAKMQFNVMRMAFHGGKTDVEKFLRSLE
ncbi:hypothetical protein [Moraxella sp. ZY210820]|uniref:hypothetical protein n=1 Tax=Moraxella sp. ZY210820 TaxID=2904123 RepID=UPI002730428D|nr:hypothetical protein [Moraxella sp. ZY210820]WLF84839.1 hypothetical protein LU301_05080 [Moraxella sp. ZY210820]